MTEIGLVFRNEKGGEEILKEPTVMALKVSSVLCRLANVVTQQVYRGTRVNLEILNKSKLIVQHDR